MQPLLHLTLLTFLPSVLCENFCLDGKAHSCDEEAKVDRYSKDANKRTKHDKYFRLIEDAEARYVECESTGCDCFRNTLLRDLEEFKKERISRETVYAAKSRGTFYQIRDGRLYREKDCMFPSRCSGIEYFILRNMKNVSDIDFIINTRDYPQSSKSFGGPLPVFSFSKTLDYFDIMYPAWSFWEGGPAISLYPRGLGRWDLHRESLDKARKDIPWDRKKTLAFFRGSRTSSKRDNLILLSRKKPHLVDAQYTKNQAWKSDQDTLHAPPAKEVSLEEHCAYKYLFNYRGVAASFRHKHLFLCESLIFHVEDEWLEFYYEAMKPWIHYIPVPKDATQGELEELIDFAISNDEIARKIAQRGRDFIWKALRMKDINCYWRRLLRSYSKLLDYKPTVENSFIEIRKKKRIESPVHRDY